MFVMQPPYRYFNVDTTATGAEPLLHVNTQQQWLKFVCAENAGGLACELHYSYVSKVRPNAGCKVDACLSEHTVSFNWIHAQLVLGPVWTASGRKRH